MQALAAELHKNGIDTEFALMPASNVEKMLDDKSIPALKHGLCFVDLSNESRPDDTFSRLRSLMAPEVTLIVIHNDNRLEAYRHYQGLGAADYWAKPFDVANLVTQTLLLTAERHPTDTDRHTMCFIDTTYGGGAGLLSAVSAYQLSRQAMHTVVVDSDSRHPACGAYLGIDHEGNLPLLLDAGNRIDNTLLSQAMTTVENDLHLLNGYQPAFVQANRAQLANLHDRLSLLYPRQVWRFSGAQNIDTIPFEQCDALFPVVTGSFDSLQNASTLNQYLKSNKISTPVYWIFNARDAVSNASADSVEKHLDIKFAVKVDHYKKLNTAMVEAKSFLESNNPITQGAKKAIAVCSQDNDQSQSPWWKKLWK